MAGFYLVFLEAIATVLQPEQLKLVLAADCWFVNTTDQIETSHV